MEENAPFKGFVSVRCPINNQGIYRSGGGGEGGETKRSLEELSNSHILDSCIGGQSYFVR